MAERLRYRDAAVVGAHDVSHQQLTGVVERELPRDSPVTSVSMCSCMDAAVLGFAVTVVTGSIGLPDDVPLTSG